MQHQILAVDKACTPDRWIDVETAVNLVFRGHITQFLGEERFKLRGGTNARTGQPSVLELGSIAIIKADAFLVKDFHWAPAPTRQMLFKRDRHLCAYCGQVFNDDDLDAEHIHPESRGGIWDWMNLVSSCRACNTRKSNQTPAEAGMKLLYLPYRPSRFESLILSNRDILADQMELLLQRVPKSSRLLLQ